MKKIRINNIPKDMIDKLNDTIEKNKNILGQNTEKAEKEEKEDKTEKIEKGENTENKKNVKESKSYDPKAASSKNKLIKNNNILSDKEEIDNEKKKRYKIRSLVKVVKKINKLIF